MRRRYSKPNVSPQKEFINSYHVNEVPLPYYNPLADPYLKGYFSNSKNKHQLSKQGLLYKPSKEYPYQERRLTNFNKFLRNNSYLTPASHVSEKGSFRIGSRSSSFVDFMNEEELSRSQFVKKRS